jgi:hypothetical protein
MFKKELTVPKEGKRKFNFNRGFFEPAFTNVKNQKLINELVTCNTFGKNKRWWRKKLSNQS